MGTAGAARIWTRPMAAAELRPPAGCTCDLCRDDDEPLVTHWRPANDNPVQRQREVISEDEERLFADVLPVY